jgi:formylglycine-generating enzyme required for sulfatase activity
VASQGDKPEWGLDHEQPPHEINIVRAFAIGKYEVTFDDWDVCVADGGCDGYKPFDEGWGTGRRPVVNVSWDDANEYVTWLSRVAGAPYRLPSEAEWEYAARAGTDTAYWWGDQPPDPKQANFGETKMSREIGSHLPNPWGLHDMNGNVWEWVQDCWNDSYAAPARPDDGNAWLEGNCSRHVQRGGSWKSVPVRLRSAHRSSNASDKRDRVVGFRIARTLP